MPPSNLLLASKIVVLEEPPQIRNIPGVPTAITAFEGVTERGPVRVPKFVSSFEEFVATYGSYVAASDLPQAVESFFLNGGTAAWISRVVHYTDITDKTTATGAPGTLSIVDRGGVATVAKLTSNAGPFALVPGQHLNLHVDAAGPQVLTFTSTAATATTGAGAFVLVDLMTLVFKTKLPGSSAFGPLRTVTFHTADFVAIGAATAAETAAAINKDPSAIGISAKVVGATVVISTDKRGSGANLTLDASSTSLAALTLVAGASTGTGNVADIDAVDPTEVASLLTALPLTTGTAVASGGRFTIAGVVTGVLGTVDIEAGTTALGIFTGALPIIVHGSASGTSPSISVSGKDPGTYIAARTIAIEAASDGNAAHFNLRVKKGVSTSEIWPNLNMTVGDPRYVEDFVAANSQLVVVEDLTSPAAPPNNLPAIGSYSSWTGQDDGLVGLADSDYSGSEAGGTGLFAFDAVDNITILVVPGRSTSAVHNAMLTYCEVHRTGTCFAILDPPAGLAAVDIVTYVVTTAALLEFSEFGAIYWPRVKINNPSTAVFGSDAQIVLPPAGTIAGVASRIDASRAGGVFQPPAGVDNGVLFGVIGFETDEVLNERKRDLVYPKLINPLDVVSGSPRMIDGTRTLKTTGDFPTIAERRGAIFIEQSLKVGLLFAKHRNNDRRLRMEVKATIEVFLLRQFENGAFRGDTPAESFFVDVSDDLNPPEVVLAGQLKVRIGLATEKPTDWILLTFTQDTRQIEDRLATVLGK